ncbi:putative transcriptional regulator [Paraburkholderia piptadeniae]|uniref:Transcriptional regulator n=1 Tax=Paraburkholderia piptadeniae TaxID=1701573 RepID=A0A1N7RIQ8_9BURK|nr:IclR family transcriptional regulator [Paraburkholderia piptadeniae]SIT34998.1 putative transcriptional regulator [Paraburkholderia piptadeniae]
MTDAPTDKPSAVQGTQSVSRALDLLRRVAGLHPDGATVTDLAKAAEIDRITANRLLKTLELSGFVERGDGSKRYRLGMQAMQIGLASMKRAPLLEACRPMMKRLAHITEDTVFLVVRNGDYAHCLHYEEGRSPVRTLVLQVGGMRVLGVGSAGVTLLSREDDASIEAIYRRHEEEFRPSGLTLPRLRDLVEKTRKQGFSATDGLVHEGVSGVGVSFDVGEDGYAAISVAALSSKMNYERKMWVTRTVVTELRAAGFTPSAKLTE